MVSLVLVGSSRFLFFNFFIPQIGEFQTHSISNPSTSGFFCFWKYPNYLNSAQRDGSLLRNSRFIFESSDSTYELVIIILPTGTSFPKGRVPLWS